MGKKKVGRPEFIIDYSIVEKLASIMCTQEEIANFLGCNRSTLLRDKQFCHTYKKGLDGARMSLRRSQFKMAQTNPTMAIWLGKQYLGQRNIPESEEQKIQVIIKNDLPKIINDNLRDDPDEDLEV